MQEKNDSIGKSGEKQEAKNQMIEISLSISITKQQTKLGEEKTHCQTEQEIV